MFHVISPKYMHMSLVSYIMRPVRFPLPDYDPFRCMPVAGAKCMR